MDRLGRDGHRRTHKQPCRLSWRHTVGVYVWRVMRPDRACVGNIMRAGSVRCLSRCCPIRCTEHTPLTCSRYGNTAQGILKDLSGDLHGAYFASVGATLLG